MSRIQHGVLPFWFWNGYIQDDEILRQVKEMAEKGITGFFIHARQGLEIPYLSRQWFDKVRVAVEGAERFGLDVWLYDEYPYPSGIAGGEVLCGHPEFEARIMDVKKVDFSGEDKLELELPWGEVLSAVAYPFVSGRVEWNRPVDLQEYIGILQNEKIYQETGLTSYNRKRFFSGVPVKHLRWNPQSGPWKIYVFMQVPIKNFKYFGNFIDPLNKKAIARFIDVTHEQYKKYLGHEFGKTIKGIFTDETAPMGWDLPWSPLLPTLFMEKNGYDLLKRLPALVDRMDEDTDRTRYDYWNTVTDAFIESYDIQIHNWCRKNNLLYAGEKPVLRSSQLAHMDIPGIDAGHMKAGDILPAADPTYRHNPKIAASAAHFYKKERALCEAYHSIGWSMTMQDMKWIADWLMVQGIDMIVPHAFYYTTDSLAKHDAPPSVFFQMPAWKYTGILTKYLGSVINKIDGGKRNVNVLLVDPITSSWVCMGERRQMKAKLFDYFAQIQRTLTESHIDYYIIDSRLLAEADVTDGCIRINGEDYKALVLPPIYHMEQESLAVIEKYASTGGLLAYTDTQFGIMPKVTEIDGAIRISQPCELPPILMEKLGVDISIKVNGGEIADVLSAHYTMDSSEIYFMVNISDKDYYADVRLKNPYQQGAELREAGTDTPNTGRHILLDKGEYLQCSVHFYPFQSHLLELHPIENFSREDATENTKKIDMDIQGDWDLSLNRLNCLRMDNWRLEVLGTEEWGYTYSATANKPVSCKPIIDQLEEGCVPVPVKLTNYAGCPKEVRLPSLLAKYRFWFDNVLLRDNQDEGIWLVMEPGSIEGDWYLLLNGYRLDPGDFKGKEFYMRTNLACEITSLLKEGRNEIELTVKVSKKYHGLLNPLYIFGSFGVYEDLIDNKVWKLDKLPESSRIGETTSCGLPFYAGDLMYEREMCFDMHEGELYISIDNSALRYPVELIINGQSSGVRCWSPYHWKSSPSWLIPGRNKVILRTTTTLLELFEGKSIRYEPFR